MSLLCFYSVRMVLTLLAVLSLFFCTSLIIFFSCFESIGWMDISEPCELLGWYHRWNNIGSAVPSYSLFYRIWTISLVLYPWRSQPFVAALILFLFFSMYLHITACVALSLYKKTWQTYQSRNMVPLLLQQFVYNRTLVSNMFVWWQDLCVHVSFTCVFLQWFCVL